MADMIALFLPLSGCALTVYTAVPMSDATSSVSVEALGRVAWR